MASIDDIKKYLINHSKIGKKANKNNSFKYKTFEELVLKYGQGFDYNPYPDNLDMGLTGQCYYNCFDLIAQEPDLIYCEGFGFPKGISIGLNHAWLIDKDKKVIDPSPNWDKSTTVYYGIAFNYDWVMNLYEERAKRIGKYYLSILNANYLDDFSLLKHDMPKEALFNY